MLIGHNKKKKKNRFLSPGLLYCNATDYIHLGPFVLPSWDLRTKTTDTCMLILMLPVVPCIIKFSVSDPERLMFSASTHEIVAGQLIRF